MPCSDAPGHPQYRDGQAEDQNFEEDELLYRRYKAEHFQGEQILPSAFRFPRQSVNRQKYSQPDDVLHPDCCNGESFEGWGVLECLSSDLPTPIDGGNGVIFSFAPVHRPSECCYAHTEIWCKRGEEVVEA